MGTNTLIITPRILVCGGRDYGVAPKYSATREEFNRLEEQAVKQREKLFSTLDDLCLKKGWTLQPDKEGNWLPNVFVIAGRARGADSLAIDWAVTNWCNFQEFPADWYRYGKSAGYIRNKQMLDEGRPDIVVAFPGGKGTAMMSRLAVEAGVEVLEVKE